MYLYNILFRIYDTIHSSLTTFSSRSLLFWPKASLMTNNAVNPIVYIYSNVHIQNFLVIECLPKFIAERTKIYQEYRKSQQSTRIVSTAARFLERGRRGGNICN